MRQKVTNLDDEKENLRAKLATKSWQKISGKGLEPDGSARQVRKIASMTGTPSYIAEILNRSGSVEPPLANLPLFEQSVQELQAEYVSDEQPDELGQEESEEEQNSPEEREPTNI